MLLTYTLNALDSLIAFDTPGTNKFGITFVYKLPGPSTIASASSMASITPGATLVLVGEINILFILLIFWLTISGILSLHSTTVPSSSSAHILICSSVTGRTFPVILSIFELSSTDAEKSPTASFIAVKYISPNFNPSNFGFLKVKFIKQSISFSFAASAT